MQYFPFFAWFIGLITIFIVAAYRISHIEREVNEYSKNGLMDPIAIFAQTLVIGIVPLMFAPFIIPIGIAFIFMYGFVRLLAYGMKHGEIKLKKVLED